MLVCTNIFNGSSMQFWRYGHIYWLIKANYNQQILSSSWHIRAALGRPSPPLAAFEDLLWDRQDNWVIDSSVEVSPINPLIEAWIENLWKWILIVITLTIWYLDWGKNFSTLMIGSSNHYNLILPKHAGQLQSIPKHLKMLKFTWKYDLLSPTSGPTIHPSV